MIASITYINFSLNNCIIEVQTIRIKNTDALERKPKTSNDFSSKTRSSSDYTAVASGKLKSKRITETPQYTNIKDG